jgi:hypothetical protein
MSATAGARRTSDDAPRVALLDPGDRAARDRADPTESRFLPLFEAFRAAGVMAEPAVYSDDFADEVHRQLQRVDAVLVWCNPIEQGRRRDDLDALLRDVARAGVVVSTHPDVILKLGTKDVLVDTADLPFGSDVRRIDSLAQLERDLPARLQAGARVLKQQRGHSGIGVWRVERTDHGQLSVRHAQRGALEERMDLPALLRLMAPYFEPAQGGHMIDQAWQPRLREGMVRAYLVGDRVEGFGHQAVNALHPAAAGEAPPAPGPRVYCGPDEPQWQPLKRRLEHEWVDLLAARVGVDKASLPLLWDCDFLLGERGDADSERYVLCEINVSSVSPFPPSCIGPLVRATQRRIAPGAVA